MKHLFLILTLIATMFSTSVLSDNVKYRVDVNDGTDSATVVTGTISDSIDDDTTDFGQPLPVSTNYEYHAHWDNNLKEGIIPLVAIIMFFGLPVFIVAIVLWFKYKNKQSKYRLAEQALAAGHEIPRDLFKENEPTTKDEEIFNKGIKNAFLGIGIGVFLWLLTETEGLAAIGFLIFCMGIAQVVIGYCGRKNNQSKSTDFNRFTQDNNRGKAAWNNPEIKNNSESEDVKREFERNSSSIIDIIEEKDKQED